MKPASNVVWFRQPADREPREPWSDGDVIDLGDYFYKTLEELAADEEGERPTSSINDAEIWGVMSDELASLPIVISTAKFRDAKEWTTQPEARFKAVFTGIFSKHISGKKDGNSIVTGALGSSKRRTKNNVLANYLMGIDVDGGASMEETFQKVRAAGYSAIFYTTHSHGTTEIEIAYDKYHRWCTKEELPTDPTTAMIRRYMREQSSYVADICDSVEFIEKRHDDGMKLILRSRPIDKFRIMIPLARPYVYAEQDGAHKDVISKWESKVLGIGRSLGIEIDRAVRDPSRLFYLPRHGKDSTNHRIMLTCGRLLDIEEIESASVSTRVSGDPFDQAAAILGGTGRGRTMSPTLGLDLGQWAKDHAHEFDIASLFRDHCPDRIRHEQSQDKLTIECPFDDDHSNPGDPDDQGSFIQSAGMDAETFSFHCSHAGCYGRDRLTFLQKAMQEGWFPDDALVDKAYFNGVDDEEEAQAAGRAVEDLWNLVEQVEEALDIGGKWNRKLLSKAAENVVAIDDETIGMEVLDALTGLCKTVRDQDRFRRDWNKLIKGARQKTPTKHEVPRGFDDLRISKKDPLTGKLIPSKEGPYKIKDGGVFFDGNYLCQEVTHKSYGLDARGENATHTIGFRAYTSSGEKEFSFRRADLAKGDDVVAALGDAGFHYDLDRKAGVRTFLNTIHLPPDALIVDSSGWHDGSFVYPDGTFIPAPAETQKIQLGITTALTPFRANKGTLAGWIAAVAPVFEDGGNGKEHWALCVMAGCAGTLLGYLRTQGLQSFALIGPSSIGKSVGARLMASVQGPINQNGLFFNCNMTSNAAELVFVARNGLSPILDEAHKAPDPGVLKRIAWSDDGSGKGRSVAEAGRYVLGTIDTFVGMLCVTSEFRIRAVLENAGISVPPGQDARLFEIQCDNVKQFPEPAFIDKMVRDAEVNHGHALESFAKALMKEKRDDVQRDLEAAHAALARPGMSSLERRSLEPLATIYLAGKIMQEHDLIPQTFDVRRILDWAIDHRAGGTEVPDARATAYAALRSAYVKLSSTRILKWSTTPAQSDTKGHKTAIVDKAGKTAAQHYLVDDAPIAERLPPVGFDYSEPGHDDCVIILADEFSSLIGDADAGITLGCLAGDGHLILTGKNRKHATLPKAPHAENYRIRKAFFDHD